MTRLINYLLLGLLTISFSYYDASATMNKLNQINKPSGPYLSVKEFGAIPNTNSDQSTFIQNAIDAALNGNVKTVYFPPGKYMVKTVNIGAGITLLGYGAIIQMLPMQGKFNRMFDCTNKKYAYNGENDSSPLIIEGFTFDGNRLNQGSYKNYEVEHQAMIFLTAAPTSKGHLIAKIQNITLQEGAADGLAIYLNVKIRITHIVGKNIFRGGIQMGGAII